MSDQPVTQSSEPDGGDEVGGLRLGTNRVLLIAGVGVLVWLTGDILLLVFASLLLAIGLDGLAAGLVNRTPLARGWSLAIVVVVMGGVLAVLGVAIVPRVIGQVQGLWDMLDQFVQAVQDTLAGWGWPEDIVQARSEESQQQIFDVAGELAGRLAGITMTVLGAVGSLIAFLAIGLFAAADPGLYRRGFLRLVPTTRHAWDRAFSQIAYALRWWFLGQLVSMLVLGVTVSGGLMVIGVDLWLSLGVITALLTFIPFLGPIIAGFPVLIIGFAEGTQTGLIVMVFYLIVQNVEGNILTPMIQHRAVDLPPALLISTQVLLGALFGFMGLVLAAPLTVVAMVMVGEFYLRKLPDVEEA